MIATRELPSDRLIGEEAIYFTKRCFEQNLEKYMALTRICAPTVVLQGTGINDDLSGTQRPVGFPIKSMQPQSAEVVQSLAKWKRLRLEEYDLPVGTGIYTDMKALRPDEDLGRLHSIYVDQWDWEMVMKPEQRHLSFLKGQVKNLYRAIKETELSLTEKHPEFPLCLPSEITFVHTEELLDRYPGLTSKEREDRATKEFGAIFLIGIGGKLSNGEPHDDRAPDYDDWSTPTSDSTTGLNGDIILWNPILQQAVEISSMGIRVDPSVLEHQLRIRDAQERSQLFYHRKLLQGQLPQTIGGGIGQSRLCMFLLKKRHIGEVQVGIWPEELRQECNGEGIFLL